MPQAALAFVGTYYRSLQAHGIGNYFFNHGGIAIENLAVAVFEEAEQSGVSDDAALQRLVETGAIFAGGKCLENCGIDQHRARLMKSAEQILPGYEVDAGFSTDRGIDLRQDGGRNLDYVDAPHVD